MKSRIKRLIERAKILLPGAAYPDDDDGFLSALGVRNPEEYEKTNIDGSRGYDAIKALSEAAKEDWSDDLYAR